MFKRIFFSAVLILSTLTAHADDKQLFSKLSDLAESGNSEAQYHLGMFYNNGIGTNKNINKAFKWFEKSAASGDPLGNYKLGCYYSGQAKNVVETDTDKALQYKMIAAKNGYALAQYDVAHILFSRKDYEKSIFWLEKSAAQGHSSSLYALSSIYFKGEGLHKNFSLSYRYLKILDSLVLNGKNEQVNKQLKIIVSNLSKSQIDKENSYINKWKPKPTDLTVKAMSGKQESQRIAKLSEKNE